MVNKQTKLCAYDDIEVKKKIWCKFDNIASEMKVNPQTEKNLLSRLRSHVNFE